MAGNIAKPCWFCVSPPSQLLKRIAIERDYLTYALAIVSSIAKFLACLGILGCKRSNVCNWKPHQKCGCPAGTSRKTKSDTASAVWHCRILSVEEIWLNIFFPWTLHQRVRKYPTIPIPEAVKLLGCFFFHKKNLESTRRGQNQHFSCNMPSGQNPVEQLRFWTEDALLKQADSVIVEVCVKISQFSLLFLDVNGMSAQKLRCCHTVETLHDTMDRLIPKFLV